MSTPEILERVYTIESEIVQIEKAISIQNTGDTAAHFVRYIYQNSMIPFIGAAAGL